jgi:voltage-gated potassium channel
MNKSNALETQSVGAYEIFIVAITLLAMVNLAIIAFPLFDTQAKQISFLLDSFLVLIFFIDFIYLLIKVPSKRKYFLKLGWIDLLGCIPYVYPLRLLRLFRAYRIIRKMRQHTPEQLQAMLGRRPDRNTFFSIAFLAIVLVSLSSYAIYRFEQVSPDNNITTAADAVWWSVVTITTVGYGDRYPTTNSGRIVAIFLMFVGIGIFSAFTSYLSTVFVNSRREQSDKREKKDLIARFQAIDQQLVMLFVEIKKLNNYLDERENLIIGNQPDDSPAKSQDNSQSP